MRSRIVLFVLTTLFAFVIGVIAPIFGPVFI